MGEQGASAETNEAGFDPSPFGKKDPSPPRGVRGSRAPPFLLYGCTESQWEATQPPPARSAETPKSPLKSASIYPPVGVGAEITMSVDDFESLKAQRQKDRDPAELSGRRQSGRTPKKV